jgi:hypothetical protein
MRLMDSITLNWRMEQVCGSMGQRCPARLDSTSFMIKSSGSMGASVRYLTHSHSLQSQKISRSTLMLTPRHFEWC